MPSDGSYVKVVVYSSHCRDLMLFQITLSDAKQWLLCKGCGVQLTLQRLDAVKVCIAVANANESSRALHSPVCA